MNNEKLDTVLSDISELKILVTKQELNLGHLNSILDALKDDVKTHIKRSDALEDLFLIVKEEQLKLREEHNLTKQLLTSKIEKEQLQSEHKSEHIWTILKTIFYTLSSVGAVLLALKQLEIFDKFF